MRFWDSDVGFWDSEVRLWHSTAGHCHHDHHLHKRSGTGSMKRKCCFISCIEHTFSNQPQTSHLRILITEALLIAKIKTSTNQNPTVKQDKAWTLSTRSSPRRHPLPQCLRAHNKKHRALHTLSPRKLHPFMRLPNLDIQHCRRASVPCV